MALGVLCDGSGRVLGRGVCVVVLLGHMGASILERSQNFNPMMWLHTTGSFYLLLTYKFVCSS